MYTMIIGMWGLCFVYFSPRLFALLIGPEFFLAKIFLFLFISIQIIFWFYIFFHLVIIGFSYVSPRLNKNMGALTSFPPVALLYTTCNDFREEVALNHLAQNYPEYHLFILDDSTQADYQEQIDRFMKEQNQKVSVIRRRARDGFKAGNVNHALAKIPSEYEYFSITDADTILPADYIQNLLPYIINDPNIAFVQANLKSYVDQSTDFAGYFAINTDIHFQRYTITKNTYGFVMWYGHGALLRRDVYNALGGFSPIATEDLAYSLLARQKGYQGVYCNDVVCFEEFPPTYLQYRHRNEKWIRGTTQCLLKFYPDFLKAKNVSWVEKVDVLASAGTLLLALPYILFLILGGIILPFFYHHFQFAGPMFKLPIGYDHLSLGMIQQIQSNLFWSWDLFILLLATIFAPTIPVFIDYWQKPKVILNYLNVYVFCFFSVQLVSAIHFLVAVISRTAVFPVTGAKQQPDELCDGRTKQWFLRSHANKQGILLMELAGGIFFLAFSIGTENIWFLPIVAGLLISPCVFYWNLTTPLMRRLIVLPSVAVSVLIYFIIQGLLRI
jgi:cellulose synthase/poly-beta-1,6-N-acetylglucosamine synthase-like glycosyltransferase